MKRTALATVIAFTLFLVGGPLVQPVVAQGPPAAQGITVPVTGAGPLGTFVGALNLQNFAVVDGVLSAVGTLTGTLTTTAGQTTGIIRNLAIPINPSATQASCSVLHLELAPLNLDVLGLVVQLDRVVLDISAVPGSGNLLGNLLCAVAGLLDGSGPLPAVTALLNRILGLLG
jgi:hypothetical protein